MKRQIGVRIAFLTLVSVAAGMALADGERETLGFWTFDGVSGEKISPSTGTVVVPNRVQNADEDLRLEVVIPDDATIPIYTNAVQNVYIYEGPGTGTLLAQTATSLFKTKKGSVKPTLKIRNVGKAIGNDSFTLEMLMRKPYGSGWDHVATLGTNTAGVSLFEFHLNSDTNNMYKTSNKFTYASVFVASLAGGTSYPNYQYSSSKRRGLNDGEWHHFAISWTASTRKMSLRTDYAEFVNFTYTGDLSLASDAAFSLLSGIGYGTPDSHTVQAIRLTRGSLPTLKYMQTLPFASWPEVAAHYRFEGDPGEVFVECRNLVFDRSDLRAWKEPGRPTPSNPYVSDAVLDTTVTYSTPVKACVRAGSTYYPNLSTIGCVSGSDAYTATRLSWDTSNAAYANISESFTYEMFIKPHLAATIENGVVALMGEYGGPEGSTDAWRKGYNWFISQYTPDDAKVRLQLLCRYVEDSQVKDLLTYGYAGVYCKVEPDQWHHIAFTYDAETRKITWWVNYKSVSTYQIKEGGYIARGNYVHLPVAGPVCDYNARFDGEIDEFRLTRRALQPSEFLKPTSGRGSLLLVR